MLIKDIMNLVLLEIIFSFSLFIGILYIVLNIQEYLHKRKIKDKKLRKEVNS